MRAFALLLLVTCACSKSAPPSGSTNTPGSAPTAARSAASPNMTNVASPNMTNAVSLTDPQLFVRNQPPSNGLVAWNGGVVTRTAPLRFVDVASAKATTLEVPSARAVLDVATRGNDVLALAAMNDGKLVVAQNESGTWRVLDTVTTKYDDKTAYRLAADGSTLVVWEPTQAHVKAGANWRSVPIAKLDGAPRGYPKLTLLAKGVLYLGYAAGEWGGGLVSVDIDRGTSKLEQAGDATTEPVTGLVLDPKGTVYVTRGQSHLGIAFGALHRQNGAAFELVALSPGKLKKIAPVAWTLGNTAFESVAFDEQGRLNVLSGSLGIAQQADGGAFTRVTTEWPDWIYVNGLVFRGDVAVIGTYDAGVVLVDTKTRRALRVTL